MANEVRQGSLDSPQDDGVRLSPSCPQTVCRKCYGLLVSAHGSSRGGEDAGYVGANTTIVRCQQQPPQQRAVPSAPPLEELDECSFKAQQCSSPAAAAAEVDPSWRYCSAQPFGAVPGPYGAATADASCDPQDGSQLNRDSHGADMKRVKNSPKALHVDAAATSRSSSGKSTAWWQEPKDGCRKVECSRAHCRRTIYSHEAGPHGLCKQCCELAALCKAYSESQRNRHQNQ